MSYQRKRSVSVNDRGHVVGEDHHRSRLSDHEVDLIRELRADGMSLREISAKFEISLDTAKAISSGRRRVDRALNQKFVPHLERRFRPARARDFDEVYIGED